MIYLSKYFPLVAHLAHVTNAEARPHAARFMDTVLWGIFKYKTSEDANYSYIDTAVKVAYTDDFCAGVQAYSPHVGRYTPSPFGGQFAHSALLGRSPIEHETLDSDCELFTDCVPDLGVMFKDGDGEYGYHEHNEVEAWGYRNLMMSVIGYAHGDSRCIITMNDVVNVDWGSIDYCDPRIVSSAGIVGAVDYMVNTASEGILGMSTHIMGGFNSPWRLAGSRADGWNLRPRRTLNSIDDVTLYSTPPICNRNSGNDVSVHSLILHTSQVEDGEEFYCEYCEEQSVAYDGVCECCECIAPRDTSGVERTSEAVRHYERKVKGASYRLLTRTGGWSNG